MIISHKSGVAADTSGHQLAQQLLMYASLTSLKEDFCGSQNDKICVFKLFELQGFEKLPLFVKAGGLQNE